MNNKKDNVIEPVLTVLNRSNNERWFNFHLEFDGIMVKWTPNKLGIAALYPDYKAKLEQADLLLELPTKSFLSGEIGTADNLRDEDIRGLKTAVKAFLKSSDPQKKKAATKVMITFDKYGDFTKLDYAAESGAVYNFLQDMKGKHSEDITTLGLNTWITDLETHNNQTTALLSERDAEKVDKPEGKLVKVRREVDTAFGNILKTVEVFIMNNPDHGLDEFVKEVNVLTKRYRTVAAQEKGRKNAKNTNSE
jgi:hypothetical protein